MGEANKEEIDYSRLYQRDELLRRYFGPESIPERWRFNRWVRDGLAIVRDGRKVWLSAHDLENYIRAKKLKIAVKSDSVQVIRKKKQNPPGYGAESVRRFFEQHENYMNRKKKNK